MAYTLSKISKRPVVVGLAALTLLAAVAYLPLLGYLLLHLEEPRRALIAAEMLASGNYWIPIHAGQIYLGKPPLFNWLICATSLPFGEVTAWSARLPSVLSIWLLTLFLVGTAWHRLGVPVALFWGCALLLSQEILLKGQLAEIDVVFTALVAAALWSWWLLDQAQRRGLSLWLLPLALTILAYLTKREPAIVFFYLTLGPYLLIQGRIKELFGLAHLGALLLAIIPALVWLLMLTNQVGWFALWQSLLHEVLMRGANTSPERYLQHLSTYPLQILGAAAPFSLLLLPLATAKLRQAVLTRHGNVVLFAAIAVLANLPLYWFKGHSAVRYFLPMLPFLLLLAALSYETLLAEPQAAGPRWQRILAFITRKSHQWLLPSLPVAISLFIIPAALLYSVLPSVAAPPILLWPVFLLMLPFTLVGLWQLRTQKQQIALSLLPPLVVMMLLLRGLEFTIYLPLKAHHLATTQNAPAIIADVMTLLPTGRPLFVSQHVPSAIWFYAPHGLLQLWADNPKGLRQGDILLRHTADHLKVPSHAELAKYRYENNDLRLELLQIN